jgi:hypothetical protein
LEYKLIEVSQEKVNLAKEKLKNLKLFTDPEQFISFFNSGFLSVNSPEIKDAAKTVAAAYRNVKLFGNKLIIKTAEEVAFDTSLELLRGWRAVSTLKRVAVEMLEESFAVDTLLLFTDKSPGIIHYEGLSEDGESIVLQKYWMRDRVVGGNAALVNNIFLGKYVFEYSTSPEENIIGIKLSDVVDIDDSFILDIQNQLIAKTLEAGGIDVRESSKSDEENEENEENNDNSPW